MKSVSLFIAAICLASFGGVLYAVDDAPHKLAPEKQAEILKLQLQMTRIMSDFQGCKRDFPGEYNVVGARVQALIDKAYVDQKIDKKEWDLNLDTFEFVKKATTASPAPAPAKTEEPKKKP